MANTKQFKLDATTPFYAVVGAGDLAVEFARTAATDVQTRISKVDLTEDAKEAQAKLEARVADFQSDAKKLPAKVESFVNVTVAEAAETYDDLAARGKDLVNRIRKQQATQDAKTAGKTAVTKVKTAKTQTSKSARSSGTAVKNSAKNTATTTATAAKETGATTRRNVKATSTSAKKTASAAAQATSDGASKVGN